MENIPICTEPFSASAWRERPFDAGTAEELERTGLSRLMSRLLSSRGVTVENLECYLNPSLSDLAPAFELPGIDAAVEAALDAVKSGSRIVVFGDYDCDGICASVIAVSALKAVGANVEVFIPHRLSEGYGMTSKSLKRMLEENPGVKLVITVDNGINSVDEVEELSRRGVEVVVTDHHLPSGILPAARAVVNPKVASSGRLDGLCGSGVAFMFANGVVTVAKKRGLYSGGPIGGSLLVMAGLATVTDIMPLTGQNRILVTESLRRFGRFAPLGLRELYRRAARSVAMALTVRDFAFLLGPRINAAGRMSSGMEAVELLLSEDADIVGELARMVDVFNVERKSVEQKMTEAAMSRAVAGAPAQVIELPEGHPGVAGIVAARVMERLCAVSGGRAVPVCIVVGGHGSARSPEGLNICDAMHACASALERFGGHAAAGGFKVEAGKIDDFRRMLCEYCARTEVGSEVAHDIVDAWVQPEDLTLEFAEEIKKMEPFGEGNPEPVFAVHGAVLSDVRPLGADGRHLQLTFRNRSIPRAVWWNHGELIEKLRGESAAEHDIRFTLELSEYGERHLELRLQSVI